MRSRIKRAKVLRGVDPERAGREAAIEARERVQARLRLVLAADHDGNAAPAPGGDIADEGAMLGDAAAGNAAPAPGGGAAADDAVFGDAADGNNDVMLGDAVADFFFRGGAPGEAANEAANEAADEAAEPQLDGNAGNAFGVVADENAMLGDAAEPQAAGNAAPAPGGGDAAGNLAALLQLVQAQHDREVEVRAQALQALQAQHDRQLDMAVLQRDAAQATARAQDEKLRHCLCTECAEVALLAPKHVTCPAGHPMCGECLDGRLQGAIANADDSPLLCSECVSAPVPAGAPAPLPLRADAVLLASTPATFDRYKAMLAEKQARRAASDEAQRTDLDHLIADRLTLRTPCCGQTFNDFEGCCAVSCGCGRCFCAFCWQVFGDDRACHSHVMNDCAINPDRAWHAMTHRAKALLHLSFEARRAVQLNGGQRFAAPI